MCEYYRAELSHTVQNQTVWIIFPLNLKTDHYKDPVKRHQNNSGSNCFTAFLTYPCHEGKALQQKILLTHQCQMLTY